jgi:hypothetical protein
LATTRVYILAKELGVKSSSIVKKCQDEGLDVRITWPPFRRVGGDSGVVQWEDMTTVETADKVDLDEVRVRKRPQRRKSSRREEFRTERSRSLAEVARRCRT